MRLTEIVLLAQRYPKRAFAALFVIYGLLLGAWGAATPLGQTPDEWAHIFRASAVVQGQVQISQPGATDAHSGDPVRIPQTLARRNADTACYRHHPSKPVSCAKKPSGSQHNVHSVTTASRYPPVYYAVVGWPLLFGTHNATLYLMRLMTVIVSALLLASAALAALRVRGRFTLTGLTVAVTPMAAYLAAMINPNGVEIAGAAALWANALLWIESPGPRARRAGLLGAAIAAATIVLARTVAIIWVLVVLASLVILVKRTWWTSLRARRTIVPVGGVVVAGVFALVWAVWAREFQIAPIRTATFHGTHYSLVHNMTRAYHALMHWTRESIADFGWLDTILHQPFYDLYFAAFFVLLGAAIIGVVRGRWRAGIASGIAAGLTVLLTMYLSARSANELKLSFWQGRYSMPMAMGVPILLAYTAGTWRGRWRWLAAGVSAMTVALVSAVMLDGFLTFFTRNTVGLPHGLTLSGHWQPPLGIVTWLVVLVLAQGAIAALCLLSSVAPDPELEPDPEPASPSDSTLVAAG